MKMVSLRLSFPNNEIHGKEGMGGFRVRRKGGGVQTSQYFILFFFTLSEGGEGKGYHFLSFCNLF